MVIFPGDRIWAQVRFSGEWIVEGEDGLPVPQFSAVTFSGSTSMAGSFGAIGSRAWLRNSIDEWAGSHRRLRVSPLSPDGASFSVTWLHG
jgi:hypothetical protein